MSWDNYAQQIAGTTVGSGIISIEGALCGKCKDFPATPQECVIWAKILKNPSMARQRGLNVGGKTLFATEYGPNLIVARRDNYCLIIQKSISIAVAGIVDAPLSISAAKDDIQKLVSLLSKSGY